MIHAARFPERAPLSLGSVGALVRRCYLPTVVLAFITIWLVWVGADRLVDAGQLVHFVLSAQNELTGPIVIGGVLAVICCERYAPAVRRPMLSRGHLQDGCFFFVFALTVVPLVTFLGVGITSVLSTHFPWLLLRIPPFVPQWIVVVCALVLMDGANWLTHLAHHRISALWRVHAVHHSQEELSVLTTFRAHPIVHTTSSFMATLPVIALTGYHPMTPVLITGYLLLGALPHANVAWSYGPFGKIFISPAYHRLHHKVDGPQDVNLGIVLTIWDVLARRAVFPARGAEPCMTGLLGRPLEIEQQGRDYGPWKLLARQLLEPFVVARDDATRSRSLETQRIEVVRELI